MTEKQLSIITTTYNCKADIGAYFEAFAALEQSKFDWIVVDAASTDGTAQFLRDRAERFAYFVTEPDAGFYFGLNKAVASVKTPYYMVFGADDRPSTTLLDDVLPLLSAGSPLVLGAVRLMPNRSIKRPGARWLHNVILSKAVSHHSVGTVIKTDIHERFGRYDTSFALLADGLFLKRILKSPVPVQRTNAVFGEFMLGGMSTKQEIRSMAEIFQLQVAEGSNAPLQLLLLAARVAKRELKKFARCFA